MLTICGIRLKVLTEDRIVSLDNLLSKATSPVILEPKGKDGYTVKDCGDSTCDYSGCASGMKTLLLEVEKGW